MTNQFLTKFFFLIQFVKHRRWYVLINDKCGFKQLISKSFSNYKPAVNFGFRSRSLELSLIRGVPPWTVAAFFFLFSCPSFPFELPVYRWFRSNVRNRGLCDTHTGSTCTIGMSNRICPVDILKVITIIYFYVFLTLEKIWLRRC